jgi:hypothetical protein
MEFLASKQVERGVNFMCCAVIQRQGSEGPLSNVGYGPTLQECSFGKASNILQVSYIPART